MHQPQHNHHLNNKQQDLQQEFCYNDSAEKYIGKHTGKLFGRINPKNNFDGFTRFSEYESRRGTEILALANEFDSSCSNRELNANNSKQSENIGRIEPFPSQESPIIKLSFIQKVSNFQPVETERKPVSSVKRTSSSIRPSKMKTYKDLLSDLNDEEFKSFIFNEEQITEIANSALKEKQLNPQKEKVSYQTELEKPQLSSTVSVQHKRSRLLKQIEKKNDTKSKFERQKIFEKGKFESGQKKGSKNQSISKKNEEIRRMKTRRSHILQFYEEQKYEIGNETKMTKLTDVQQNQSSCHNQGRYAQMQQNSPVNQYFHEQQQQVQGEKENQKSFQYVDAKEQQISHSSKNQVQFQQQKPKVSPNKRQRKYIKESRIVGSPINCIQQTRHEFPLQESTQKVYPKTQTKHYRKRAPFGNQNQNMKIKSQEEGYLERLGGQSEEKSNSKRYPLRTRIKPVHFWENEKVHYKAGRAAWIERAQVNLGDILQTNNKYDNIINLNFHNHEIGIEMVIPPMKIFISGGIKQPHQSLHISLSNKIKDFGQFTVIFDDGIRSEKIKQNETIEVGQNMKFELKNQSKLPAIIQLKVIS